MPLRRLRESLLRIDSFNASCYQIDPPWGLLYKSFATRSTMSRPAPSWVAVRV